MIGIQADLWDPFFFTPAGGADDFDHYTDFVQALAKEAREFGKPVLLLNGDSHVFTDDLPLAASAPAINRSMYGVTTPVNNLRRITVNGSNTCPHEWLKLTADAALANPFSVVRVPLAAQPPCVNL